MKHLVIEALACVGGVLAAGTSLADSITTVYENDFSTRRSAEPVVSANWIVSHYATNDVKLTNNHTVNGETITMGYVNPWQDGWFKMHRGKTYANNNQNLGLWYVRGEDGNPYASYSTSIGSSQTLHAHPIYNAITCGVIRTTFDIRIPKKVHANFSRLSFTLGTRNMMVESTSKADMVSTGTGVMQKSLFEAGFNVNNYGTPGPGGTPIVSEDECVKVMGCGWDYGRDATSGDDGSKTGPWPSGGVWARVIVEADLDGNTYDVSMVGMTATHPTFDTVPTAKATTRTGRKFYTAYNPAVDGPITGIIFHNVYGGTGAKGKGDHYYLEEDYDDDYAFKMDNVKMEWKAPGKADFEAFYMNDFGQCKRRTLTPTGTTANAYAATTGSMTDVLTYDASYVMPYGDYVKANVKKQLVEGDTKALNPVGYDGWRRIDGGSAIYLTTCGVHRVLAMVTGTRCWLAQQIGETLTNGTVKFEYDMRAPSRMYKVDKTAQQGFVTVCLGSQADWDSCIENPGQYFRAAMACKNTTDAGQREIYPYFAGEKWSGGFGQSSDTLLTSQKWYRMAITFNLDKNPRTAVMTCTEIGDALIGIDETPAAGARKMTSTELKFRVAFEGLSSLILGTYSAVSTKIDEAMLVTNLKVTKNVGAEDEKVVYKNDFKTRTRYLDDVTTTRIAPTAHDRMFEGLDAWQRNNAGTLDAYVTAGENPALMPGHTDSLGYFAQSIGGHYKNGAYTVQADFRVPDYWYGKDGWCDVLVGNDMLKTGTNDLAKPNNIYNHPANYFFGMHLYPVNSANGTNGLYKRTRFLMMCGDSYDYSTDLTTNHWYRCVCTLYLAGNGGRSKTLDFALYDMGTEHPTAATATPATPVASAAGRAIVKVNHGGEDAFHMSTVGVRFRQTANYAFWREDESGCAMVDNIRIDRIFSGMTLLIR